MMDFTLSEERRIMQQSLQRLLADDLQISSRIAALASDAGHNPLRWRNIAELGGIGMILPAEAGGYGGEGEDIALVFEAMGRNLVAEPMLATAVLGATPLWMADAAKYADLLADVMNGNQLMALCHGELESRYSLTRINTKARQVKTKSSLEDWVLDGEKTVVFGGSIANWLVVSGRISDAADDSPGIGLFLVRGDAHGVMRRSYSTIDAGPAAEVSFTATPAQLITKEGLAILEAVHDRAALALAAEAVGIAAKIQETTLDYLKTREQFGRRLSSFQVLQHRMVDMLLDLEQLRSAVQLASMQMAAPGPETRRVIAAAKCLAGRLGKRIAEEAIQLHGGIAVCHETEIAHYARRLIMLDHQIGDADHYQGVFMRLGGMAG